MRRLEATALGAILCALILLTAGYARADSPPPRTFDIGAQSLAAALNEFGRQSQQEILFAPDVVANKHSEGVHGKMESLAALQTLLRGTGLTSVTTPNGAILVGTAQALAKRAQTQGAASNGSNASKKEDNTPEGADRKSLWERLRLAHLDTGKTSDDAAIGPSDTAPSKPSSLDEVVITGSRIASSAKQQAQPVLVYTSEDIDRSGQTTVTDFLNNMPQMSITSNPGGSQTFASQRGVQLHGLPLGTTLVLLDGQRTQVSYYGTLDLSMIPASAIERVEIIPVGSSAVYGSDALAGVVNLVLKKHFDGFEANVKYGFATGTNDLSGNIAAGKDWERGSVSLVLSGQHQSDLAAYERAETRTMDFTNRGGTNYNYDACNPGTVYALNGQTLNGLGTTSATIPAGLTGKPTIADFAATAGKVNECNLYARESLVPETTQASALLSGQFAITPSLELFGNVLYSHFLTRPNLGTLFNMIGGAYVMTANNPYNPFGQDIGVGYAYGLWKEDRTQEMIRPTIGLRGDLPGEWHWEVTGLYSHDSFEVLEQNRNRANYRAALASSDPATALNIFASGAPASDAVLATFATLYHDRYSDSLASEQALVRGPLFTLPSGTVRGVFGITHDRYEIWDQLVADAGPGAPSSRGRNATALFTEERVPLWANTKNPADGEILALSAAARWDHSSDFGSKATYQGGLEWRPIGGLLVRGAYGTSYRAPQLGQLYGSTYQFASTITDPARGIRVMPLTIISMDPTRT